MKLSSSDVVFGLIRRFVGCSYEYYLEQWLLENVMQVKCQFRRARSFQIGPLTITEPIFMEVIEVEFIRASQMTMLGLVVSSSIVKYLQFLVLCCRYQWLE